jgi:YVTN family beta-propeller protein
VTLSRRRFRALRAFTALLAGASLFLALSAPGASARNAYVTNLNSETVSVIDTQTNQVVGEPIHVGSVPREVAITPDGSRAYVGNRTSNDIYVIDTRTNQVVGDPIKFADDPIAIAITPDGTHAYVAQLNSKSILVIDTRTNQVVGNPIEVGAQPRGIAITPDGTRAYVANKGSDSVSIIDTRTSQVVGNPITVGHSPRNIAITPDGTGAYVTNSLSESVSVIDTRTNLVVGEPIKVGDTPSGIAITPDGSHAYVVDENAASVSVIDTHTNQVIGEPIKVGASPRSIAITPDGSHAYVANENAGTVSVIDTHTNQVVGEPITVGAGPFGVAIPPDQPPLASFSAPRVRPGVSATFDASASRDPDGTISTYGWDFGDKQTSLVPSPTTAHTYSTPGTYQVTLRLTDNEGCSSSLLFTGQTVFCNAQATAATTKVVMVAFPGVRVSCPKSAKPRGCRFKLQVIAGKPKRGHKAKTESAVARVKVKPGHSAIVSLKARSAFRGRLAGSKKVLVKEASDVGGRRSVHYRTLKIVQ